MGSLVSLSTASQNADGVFLKVKCLNGLGKTHENRNDLEKALTYYKEAYELAAESNQKENKNHKKSKRE